MVIMTDKELKDMYTRALSRCIIMMGDCTDDVEFAALQSTREVLLNAIMEIEKKELDGSN